jgi:hypothetical protein
MAHGLLDAAAATAGDDDSSDTLLSRLKLTSPDNDEDTFA